MKIKIIDLFAGIGGMRLGFEQAAPNLIKCVFTSEWDKFAVQTYKANFSDEDIYGDITKIKSEDIPDHNILLAGFPCQPFSMAGHRKGFSDTRGTLFFEIERILLAKKPDAFLLENVKHLMSHGKGRTFQVILEHLKAAGYNMPPPVVLNARNFGIPQNRQRLFITGFLDKNIDFSFPAGKDIKLRVGDFLQKGRIKGKYTISNKLWIAHQRRKIKHKKRGNGFGYGLFNLDASYVNTISARYYKDGCEVLIEQKGKNPRKLTPRECVRLMGFPEDFVIPVSDNQAYRQFGNSVAIPVVQEIAKRMMNALRKSKRLRRGQNKSEGHASVFPR